MDELQEYLSIIKKDQDSLNKEKTLISQNISKIDIMERLALNYFQNLDKFLKNHQFSNNEMKKIIEKIVADKDGTLNIYIRDLQAL